MNREHWKRWLGEAVVNFERLKAQEKYYLAVLRAAERTLDFRLQISCRAQWFEVRERAQRLNQLIVQHLSREPRAH